MDFQAMYENMQTEIKNKVTQINDKKSEIAVLEADVYKIQGAVEMLVLISKQMEQQKQDDETEAEVKPADEETK